jgi:hypothetical protein
MAGIDGRVSTETFRRPSNAMCISTPIARYGRRINFALMAATRGGTVTEYPRYKLVQDHLGFKVTAPKDVMRMPGARPSASKHNGQIDFQRLRTTVRHASLGST